MSTARITNLPEYLEFQKKLKAMPDSAQPSDLKGLVIVARVFGLMAMGAAFSFSESLIPFVFGQLLMALSFFQCFILLHSCGHFSLFKTAVFNYIFGFLASVFSLLPFLTWKWVHTQHHQWSGWKGGIDPTMGDIDQLKKKKGVVAAMNFFWRTGLPIFSIYFGLNSFWNPKKIFEEPILKKKIGMILSLAFIVAAHVALIAVLDGQYGHVFYLSMFLYFMISDPILLSQHIGVPQNSMHGVRTLIRNKPFEQDRYARTIHAPLWMSKYFFMGFNYHSLHHVFPNVPEYYLSQIEYEPVNPISFFQWVKDSKTKPFSDLLKNT